MTEKPLRDDILKGLIGHTAESIAHDIISVQPMPNDILKGLIGYAETTEKLIADGYEPVSGMGLMWVKK